MDGSVECSECRSVSRRGLINDRERARQERWDGWRNKASAAAFSRPGF